MPLQSKNNFQRFHSRFSEVQLGMNPNEASAPAVAPPDASGGSSSNAQPGPSSSNTGYGSATQSNPANEPPQQVHHFSIP